MYDRASTSASALGIAASIIVALLSQRKRGQVYEPGARVSKGGENHEDREGTEAGEAPPLQDAEDGARVTCRLPTSHQTGVARATAGRQRPRAPRCPVRGRRTPARFRRRLG